MKLKLSHLSTTFNVLVAVALIITGAKLESAIEKYFASPPAQHHQKVTYADKNMYVLASALNDQMYKYNHKYYHMPERKPMVKK